MKLYYTKGACSLAVRIILNELKLNCEYEAVDLKAKKTESSKDFLAINIKGAVPTLVTNDDQVLTENAVILQYLADAQQAHELLPPLGDFKRYRVLEWLNYITTELHKTEGMLFNPKWPQEIRNDIIIPIIKTKLTFVNEQLKDKNYLLGDSFTLPDAYLFVMLSWLPGFKINLEEWSNLSRFFKHVNKRPAVQKSLQEEGLKHAEQV
jgi:glutathione S-transferase